MTIDVRPSTMRASASRTRNSVSVSTLDVASSRIRKRGLCASARAKLMSCFCPVERPLPRSRMGCANPSGSERMKSIRFTCSAAASTSSRVDAVGAQPDVVLEVPVNRYGSCSTTPKLPPQLQRIELANVHAADADRALLHIVEAQQQADERGLARAGVAHDGDGLARLDAEADVAQHPVFVLVGEPDVVEFDARAAASGTARGAAGGRISAGVSSSLKMRSDDAMARLQDVVLLAQILNRAEEAQPILQKRHHHAQRQRRLLACGIRRRPGCPPAPACRENSTTG